MRMRGGWTRWMLLVLVAVGLAVGALVFANRGGAEPPGPALALGTTNLDLGQVLPGDHVLKSISLENTGSKPLVVRARTSNPVLRADLSTARILPDTKGTLRIDLSTQTWDPEGPFAELVLLYSNDPTKPLSTITVHGKLAAPFTWTPKIPSVPLLQPGGKPIVLVHVIPKGAGSIGPLSVTSMVPFTQASAVPDGRGFRVELTVQPDAPLGPLIGVVQVETFDPKLPEFEIPIRTQVVHNLILNPFQFDFGLVRSGASVKATAGIEVRKGQTVDIVRVDPHVPAATQVEVHRHGVNSLITLRIPLVPHRWSLAGYVNVYTSDPKQPVVQIPVVGTVWMPKPFAQAAREGSDAGLYGALRSALFIGENTLSPGRIVATVLGGVRDQRSVSLLLRALHDSEWYVRQRAIDTLGFLKAASAFNQVRAAVTQDDQAEVRRAAIAALVRIGGDRALPSLILALGDDDSFVRDDAATLLGQLGDPRAIPALEAARNDPDSLVRQDARKALAALRSSSPAP
jgi:hypothetical protein